MTRNALPIAMTLLLAAALNARAADSENLAKDPGFEMPGAADKPFLNWDFFSSKEKNAALVDTPVHGGEHALHLWSAGKKNASVGVSQTLDVVPKGRYTFKAFVLNDKASKLEGGVVGSLGIEWYDAEGAEISRDGSKEWGLHLSKMHWEEYSAEAKAPPYAAKVKFVVLLKDGEKDGSQGGVFVDDVEVSVKQK